MGGLKTGWKSISGKADGRASSRKRRSEQGTIGGERGGGKSLVASGIKEKVRQRKGVAVLMGKITRGFVSL